jgi:lactoylglutathione lyase
MDENNVTFQKRPEDGRMHHIAFVKDPDGYWIELVGRQ